MGRKMGRTSASRSRDFMRKLGWEAECVEHRRGNFIRVDLFGFADVMAYKEGDGILLIQAYRKDTKKLHDHMDKSHPKIREFIAAGGRFEHHIWTHSVKGGKNRWTVERSPIFAEFN